MPPLTPDLWHRQLIATAAYMIQVIGVAATLYTSPFYWKQDYHTSALSGEAWVKELIHSHPDQIGLNWGCELMYLLLKCGEIIKMSCEDV